MNKLFRSLAVLGLLMTPTLGVSATSLGGLDVRLAQTFEHGGGWHDVSAVDLTTLDAERGGLTRRGGSISVQR